MCTLVSSCKASFWKVEVFLKDLPELWREFVRFADETAEVASWIWRFVDVFSWGCLKGCAVFGDVLTLEAGLAFSFVFCFSVSTVSLGADF